MSSCDNRTKLSGLRVVVGLALVFAVLLMAGCGSPGDIAGGPAGNVFRMNLGTEPPDLDPIRMTDLTSFTVVQNIMRGLTLIGEGQEVVPAVAERWDVSADGLTYTFYLRENAQWSDGKPVTAHDFLYGWRRALTSENGAEYAFFLFEIENARSFYEGKITDFSQVGAKALDDKTLQVKLERPVAFFLGLMAAPVSMPMREDVIEKYGDQFVEAGHYVTNGPYTLDTWVHEERIVLRPDSRFYGNKPKVGAVVMYMINDANTSVVMYENNELDYIETTTSIPSFDVRRLRKFPEAKVTSLHRINYIAFNTNKPPFDDPRVRRAFAHALDRSYYPRLMQAGEQPIASFITPGLEGYNPDIGLKYDPAKAKQLLAEAGFAGNLPAENFPRITLGYRTMYDIQKEAEIAQFQWKKDLGVDVKLDNMEWKVYLSRLKQDPPHLYKLGWFVDYPDADSFMALWIAESGNNYTRWHNPEYDRLVKTAAVTLDPEKRQALYDAAQRILLEEEAVLIPLYVAEKTYLLKPWVRGFKINEINLINLDSLSVAGQTENTP